MGRKAQAAVEYLVTYGWMIVAVAVLGGATYQTFSGSCNLRIEGSTGTFPRATDLGQYSNQTLVMEISNTQKNPITLNTVNFTKNGDVLASVPVNKELNGEASMPVRTNRFQNSDSCHSYKVNINYASKGLQDLQSTFKVIGKVKLVELRPLFSISDETATTEDTISFDASDSESSNEITSYSWNFGDGSTATGPQVSHSYSTSGAYNVELTLTDSKGNTNSKTKQVYIGGIITYSGGSMQQLGITNTLASTCIGNNCTNATATDDTPVKTSGDRIKGTLLTDKILKLDSKMCITSKQAFDTNQGCQKIITGPDEELSKHNYEMTGSLNATVIKPYQEANICLGDNC